MHASGTVVRYAVVGGLGVMIQTATLYIWVSVLHLENIYLVGILIGFCIALALTFVLQKWWTFSDHSLSHAKRQFVLYTVIALISVALNAILLHFTKSIFDSMQLDFFDRRYLAAETVIALFVAFLSFLANRLITFERPSDDALWHE